MKDDRKTRYTRMVLQDSLIELMKEKPISKITIKELCEKADVNRSTFYAHYSDQYNLLRTIENETFSWVKEAIASLIGKTDKEGIIKVLEGMCQYIVENSRHLQVLMSEQGDIDFQKELFMLIYNQCGISSLSAMNPNLIMDEDYLIFVVNGSIGLIQHWLKNGFNKPAAQMAELIYNLAIPVK